MPRQETVLSVFVASPDDVVEERGRLEDVIRELNTTWSRQFGLRLELVRWETHAYPGFGEDPQAVLNEQIPQDFDIFIGLMWYRFGTPTGRAGSGTIEEFEHAKTRHDTDPTSVQLMIYFKDAPAPISPSQLDHAQLANVSEFRSRLGHEGGLYWSFQTPKDFETLVRLHLSRRVQRFLSQSSSSPAAPARSGAETPMTDTAEQAAPIEDDGDAAAADEVGLLDLMEQVDDEFSIVLEVTERIADATKEVGDKIKARTAEMNDFSAGPDSKNRKIGKKLFDKAAADMDHFVDRMESELPLYSKHLNSGMAALVGAAMLAPEFKGSENSREQTQANLENVRGFRETVENVETQIAGFRQAVTAVPPVTRKLNRSKRAMASVLQRVINELHGTQVMAREAETSFASALEEDE